MADLDVVGQGDVLHLNTAQPNSYQTKERAGVESRASGQYSARRRSAGGGTHSCVSHLPKSLTS